MMKTPPRIHWRSFSIPKWGNRPEENEDACWHWQAGPFNARHPGPDLHTFIGEPGFACALADGATRTSFSGLWARLLVDESLQRFSAPQKTVGQNRFGQFDLADVTSAAQARWAGELAGMQLPWHAEEKVRQGAFATLLWFGLCYAGRTARAGGAWQAVAVGDTCLFQVRGDQPVVVFPPYSASDFARDPVLLSTIPARNAAILSSPRKHMAEGAWSEGDEFLLMTDALAAWFLRENVHGAALQRLKDGPGAPLGGQPGFAAWVTALREAGKIKNDDTTLAWITLDARPPGRPAGTSAGSLAHP